MNYSNASSVEIVEVLMKDLLKYLYANIQGVPNRFIFHQFFGVPFFELETDKRIQFARVALYEQPEVVDLFVDDHRANLSDQAYHIDLSVVRAYTKDDHTRGEFPLMMLKDAIVDWSKQVDASQLTNGYIYTFGYTGTDIMERNERLVSRSLIFTARRDLYKPQIK